MKLLKTISKNMFAFILLLTAILWIIIPFLILLIKRYWQELNNFIDGRKTEFPRIFSKDFYCEIRDGIKKYFKLKLCEQALSTFLLMMFFTYINTLSKWSFNKNGGSAVTPINTKTNDC